MSHRRPLTAADRFIASLEKMHPAITRLEGTPFGSTTPEAMEAMTQVIIDEHITVPDDGATLYRAMYEEGSIPLPQDLSLWSNWRLSRQVYRFDKDLTAALVDTAYPDDMPLDALERLPYRCFFVEATCHEYEGPSECTGFFCWRDKSRRPGATDADETREYISLCFITEDGEHDIFGVRTGEGSLGEMIEHIVSSTAEYFPATFGVDTAYETSGTRVRRLLSFACAHLLYIVSKNSDQEVVYRPSGETTRCRAGRHSTSTIHAVGTRVGHALGKARIRYVGEGRRGDEEKRTVSAHMRTGHWHHFWRGPRGDPERRELVVHWIAPILVNAGKHSPNATVVHDALPGYAPKETKIAP